MAKKSSLFRRGRRRDSTLNLKNYLESYHHRPSTAEIFFKNAELLSEVRKDTRASWEAISNALGFEGGGDKLVLSISSSARWPLRIRQKMMRHPQLFTLERLYKMSMTCWAEEKVGTVLTEGIRLRQARPSLAFYVSQLIELEAMTDHRNGMDSE